MSLHPVPSAPTSDEYIDPDALLLKVKTSPPPRYNDVIQVSVEEDEERFVPEDVEKARAAAVKRGNHRSKTMMVFKVILIFMLVSTFCLAAFTTHSIIVIKGSNSMQAAIALRTIRELQNDRHERMSEIWKIKGEVSKDISRIEAEVAKDISRIEGEVSKDISSIEGEVAKISETVYSHHTTTTTTSRPLRIYGYHNPWRW